MAKNKKSKIKKILIILFVVIVILVALLLILLNKSTEETDIIAEKLDYINNDDEWDDETIYPDYAAALGRSYEGDWTVKSIGKSMYYVATEVFPEYYQDLKTASESEITQYYEENEENIYINLAIEKESVFIKLIEELQELSGDSITWESFRIDLDSIKVGSSYTKAVLYITYENNEEIAFNIKINNTVSTDCSTIVYTANTE